MRISRCRVALLDRGKLKVTQGFAGHEELLDRHEGADYRRRRLYWKPSGNALAGTSGGADSRLDNFRSGNRCSLRDLDLDVIEASVLDTDALHAAVSGVDIVFHLAAMISAKESMENPRECVEINTLGTLNVLRAAADAGVRKLVFASSAAVYGDDPPVPTVETATPKPKSPMRLPNWMVSITVKFRSRRLAQYRIASFLQCFWTRAGSRGPVCRCSACFRESCCARRALDDFWRRRAEPGSYLCEGCSFRSRACGGKG